MSVCKTDEINYKMCFMLSLKMMLMLIDYQFPRILKPRVLKYINQVYILNKLRIFILKQI